MKCYWWSSSVFQPINGGTGWLLEVPAGVVEAGEEVDLAGALRRELREEIGYLVRDVQPIYTFYFESGHIVGTDHPLLCPGYGCRSSRRWGRPKRRR